MSDLKIKRAPSVQSNDRAWRQGYDDINDIVNAVNNKSGTESRTKGTLGSDGDIRLYKDSDASKYFIEGKFKDGWANRELLFTDTDKVLFKSRITCCSISTAKNVAFALLVAIDNSSSNLLSLLSKSPD